MDPAARTVGCGAIMGRPMHMNADLDKVVGAYRHTYVYIIFR